MASLHELPFLAPVPQGHDVLVATLQLGYDSTTRQTLVHDRTASLLYCSDALWGPLGNDPALAMRDPVAALTRWTWVVKEAVAGISAGATVAFKNWGDQNEGKTRLFVEPGPATPYR